jgi:hypothetical protein
MHRVPFPPRLSALIGDFFFEQFAAADGKPALSVCSVSGLKKRNGVCPHPPEGTAEAVFSLRA